MTIKARGCAPATPAGRRIRRPRCRRLGGHMPIAESPPRPGQATADQPPSHVDPVGGVGPVASGDRAQFATVRP